MQISAGVASVFTDQHPDPQNVWLFPAHQDVSSGSSGERLGMMELTEVVQLG